MSSKLKSEHSFDYSSLVKQLSRVMLQDRRGFAARLKTFKNGQVKTNQLNALKRKMQASEMRAKQRHHRFEQVAVSMQLPIAQQAQEIVNSIRNNPVTIVAGATGSGKTTQIPKLCLQSGYGVFGTIAHTQPRRIAARATAARIAEELNTEVGQGVGYKVRFVDHSGPECQIKLLTDGMLLQEAHLDRGLLEYDCLIIDEAHERSLNIDFLLGIVKKILAIRPNLRVVITSATINPQEFSEFFDHAPIIEVSGRSYPIDIIYRPIEDQAAEAQILTVINEVWTDHGQGDVLVFLPGEREIRDATRYLGKHMEHDVDILPLFARLSDKQQNKIFKPTKGRQRIILTTNVAETSLTVPGIIFVIDSGVARISRYHYKSKLQRLAIENISKASAAQRAGRCGRTQPGVCVRLYPEEEFEAREDFSIPEILRTNLASVILKMSVLGLGAVRQFPFIDRPDSRFIKDGYRLLQQLEAVAEDGAVTTMGTRISRYPIDPRLGKIMVEAIEGGCLKEIQIIIAGLSAGDPRERPWEKASEADEKHKVFADEHSDFVTLLNIWNQWQAVKGGQNRQRKWCATHFLSYRRMREWHDVLLQIGQVAKDHGHAVNERAATNGMLHITLLKGFLDNVGERIDQRTYQGARGLKFHIFPGSGLQAKPPPWIVAAEIVQTSKTFARFVAKIKPAWVEVAAQHLTRKRCIDENWNSQRGAQIAIEEVSLYGMVLNRNHRVALAAHDKVEARKCFIQHALVENDWQAEYEFIVTNQALREHIKSYENKLRRFLVDEARQFTFFDNVVPEHVHDKSSFQKWWKKQRHASAESLVLTTDVFDISKPPGPVWYPDVFSVGGQDVQLAYIFDPANEKDGVTMQIPAPLLGHVQAEQLSWLVPGWLKEKVEHLLRFLPKNIRKQVVPVATCAQEFLVWAIDKQLPGTTESLNVALSRFMTENYNIMVTESEWALERLPPWLTMSITVLDADGNERAWGRDYDTLRAQLVGTEKIIVSTPDSEWQQRDMREWHFDEMPETVIATHDGIDVIVSPALVDKHFRVDLEVFPTIEEATGVHGDGVLRLMSGTLQSKVSYIQKNIPQKNQLGVLYLHIGEFQSLVDDLIMAAFSRLVPDAESIRTHAIFRTQLESCKDKLFEMVLTLSEQTLAILTQRQKIVLALEQKDVKAHSEICDDVRRQIDGLLFDGFVRKTPHKWFAQLLRYLNAIETRLDKSVRGGKEPADAQLVAHHAQRCQAMTTDQLKILSDYPWMIEEWRVSVFAQQLGTIMPVSEKRIQKYLEKKVS